MLDLSELQQQQGKTIRFYFTDGEVVEARLIGVDVAEHDDIMYETPTTTFVTPIATLQSWELIGNMSEPGPA